MNLAFGKGHPAKSQKHISAFTAFSPPDGELASVLLVSGTRPEIVKLAPVFHALRETDWARPYWLHTGQHNDMATQMLACFDVVPDYILQRGGDSLLEFSTQCRIQLDHVFSQRKWSAVIVQGDTESTFLGALAGFHHRVPVAHVEAGLRTYNLQRPFPEEGLRQMISRIASLHFAPTARAAQALRDEGLPSEFIAVTGNTVIDAQKWVCQRYQIQKKNGGRGHILVTMHRRENWGDEIDQACAAIGDIAREFPALEVLFPVHLNPIVHEPVHCHLGGLPNVRLMPPLDYLAMQQALADACIVLTDSGGLQEEAPTFCAPLLVLRNETERPEVIDAGCGVLVGTDRQTIVQNVQRLLTDEMAYRSMQMAGNPFGDGTAAHQIAAHLCRMLNIQASTNTSKKVDYVVA